MFGCPGKQIPRNHNEDWYKLALNCATKQLQAEGNFPKHVNLTRESVAEPGGISRLCGQAAAVQSLRPGVRTLS